MLKKCSSCGRSFTLTGSGNRQKYCSKTCRNRGDGGLPTTGTEVGSNALKSKAAKTGFEDAWVNRLSRLEMEGPIALLIGEDLWRLWPSQTTKRADARHWRLSVKGVRDCRHPTAYTQGERRLPPSRASVYVSCLKWRHLSLAAVIASSPSNSAERKKKKLVVLHCAGYSDTITREAFKDLVASNRRYRKRNPVKRKPALRLVVNNPPADTRKEAAA